MLSDKTTPTLVIISNIRGVTQVHAVHNDVDTCDRELLFAACARDILAALYGDKLVRVLPGELAPGQYTTIDSDLHIDIYAAEETREAGWMSEKITISRACIGTITGMPCQAHIAGLRELHEAHTLALSELRKELCELKAGAEHVKSAADNTISLLNDRITDMDINTKFDALEIRSLRAELEGVRDQLTWRTHEYTRAIREAVALRAADNLNTDTIIQLNNEVGKLRAISRPTTRFNYEAGVHCVVDSVPNVTNNDVTDNDATDTLRIHAVIANVTGGYKETGLIKQSKPTERAAIPDAGYDACINQIRAFSHGSLRTRAQRDAMTKK